MTEPTTTELLAAVRGYIIDEDQVGTSAALVELERALMRGSPLPAQWPHAKELEELRAKVAGYEEALNEIRALQRIPKPIDPELSTLRAKVAKYEEALVDIVGYREANSTQTELGPVLYPDYEDFESLESIAEEALKS